MFHLMLSDQFPHAVDVHVEVRAMFVQAHDHILGSSVGKGGNEGRASASNHLINA